MKNVEIDSTAASEIADEPILVVDDDEIKRYATRRTLEMAGFTVQEAVSGEEALALLQHASPRPWLVVLDVRLPGIDGLEVCRRIKADPLTASILVLHMSAHHTGPEDRVSGMEAGADGYVTVPSDARVLVSQARSLMRLAQAERISRDAARIARESEARLRIILESLEEGIVVRDAQGVVQVTNASAEHILGRGPDELHGRTSLDESWRTVAEDGSPLPGEQHPSMIALREGRAVVGVILGVLRPSGERVWISVNAHPLFGPQGETTGVVTSLFDVTKRRQMEMERAAAAAKQEHIAETLQRSLLLTPGTDTFPGIDVCVEYEAAWSESLLGGDFADAFALDDAHVAFVVGDVTGKGLVAATYTAEIKFALRAFLRESPAPALAMSRLNRYLVDGQRFDADPHEEYVSLAIAVLNRSTREVQCASAGAEAPLIVRCTESGTVRSEAIATTGPLLAIDADSQYTVATSRLGRGDLLALTTDGITEARRGKRGGDFFGYEGFVAATERVVHLPSLEDAARAIVSDALEFAGGEQRDDICLLLAR